MIPRAAPKASTVAVILALLAVLVGIGFGREAAIEFGAVAEPAWIGPFIDSALDTTAQSWMLPVGIAVAVLGAILLISTVLPRRRTHKPSGTDGVWIGRRRGRVSSLGRGAAAFDRLATALVALVLVVVGAAAAAWQQNRLPGWAYDARSSVDSASPGDWDGSSWWPWALTACAVVFVVLGVRWLYSHRPRRQPSRTFTIADDHASIDVVSAARSAAAAFADMPEIDSARARVTDTATSRLVRIFGTASVGDDRSADDVVAAAARLRTTCTDALDGVAVEVQVLLDLVPVRRHAGG